MRRNVNLHDIAEQCHVSVASVSRALNGRPGIGKELRSVIVQCAKDMGYIPNVAARSIRLQRSQGVILIVRGTRDSTLPFQLSHLEDLKRSFGTDVHI